MGTPTTPIPRLTYSWLLPRWKCPITYLVISRPAEHGQVERPAVDVSREGEWNAPRSRAVPCARAMRQQHLERLRRRRPQRGVQVPRLGVVGLPVARVVDAEQREGRAVAFDHMAAVLHEIGRAS